MDIWYKQLGYYENPFLLSPFKENSPLIGQESQLNDTLYYLKSGSIVFIEGATGSGKTKFLREVMKTFRGRVIYVNAATLTKTLNIEDLLRGKNGLAGKLFGKKPKDMILFLDNIDELSLVNLERLKYYFDQGYLQSIVCTGTSFNKVGFPPSLAQRIGKRIIKLSHLTEKEAVQLALERLDEKDEAVDPIISEKFIKKVYASAKKNPKQFLIQLHRVFEEMHFSDATNVEEKHLKVLEEKLDKDDREELDHVLDADVASVVDGKGSKIMKVGEYYRNPDQEMFCGNCGAIVTESDVACPECNAAFENEIVAEEKPKKGEANA
jgi:predicted AAA+ superfamily ATPase